MDCLLSKENIRKKDTLNKTNTVQSNGGGDGSGVSSARMSGGRASGSSKSYSYDARKDPAMKRFVNFGKGIFSFKR